MPWQTDLWSLLLDAHIRQQLHPKIVWSDFPQLPRTRRHLTSCQQKLSECEKRNHVGFRLKRVIFRRREMTEEDSQPLPPQSHDEVLWQQV